MRKLLARGWVVVVAFAPALAFAQNFGTNGFIGLLDAANSLIGRLIPFIIALTVLVFLWGVFKFVISNDAEGRKEARGYMVWGIVSLFIMVSVWGLVNILVRSFSLNNTRPDAAIQNLAPTTFTQ